MKKYAVAAAVALTAASPAWAQDGAARSPFSGASIAVFAGVDALTIQEDDAADSSRGLIYGGSVGYDHDLGSVVLGVQAEISNSNADFDIENLIVPGDEFSSKAGRDIYVGARLGFGAGGSTLIYVGGGYVNSRLTSVYRDSSGTISQSESGDGFRVSGGAEFGRRNWFGRIELRYQDVGDFNVFGVPTGFARTHTQIVAGFGIRI